MKLYLEEGRTSPAPPERVAGKTLGTRRASSRRAILEWGSLRNHSDARRLSLAGHPIRCSPLRRRSSGAVDSATRARASEHLGGGPPTGTRRTSVDRTLDGLASWNNGRLSEYPALAHQTVIALPRGAGRNCVGGRGWKSDGKALRDSEACPGRSVSGRRMEQAVVKALYQVPARIATAVLHYGPPRAIYAYGLPSSMSPGCTLG